MPYTQTPKQCSTKEQRASREIPDGAGEERALVARAKRGDGTAFGTLCERHRARAFSAAFRILRHQQDAEDAVQKCFVRAFVGLMHFREDSTFATWITRIVINESLMIIRQRRPTTSIAEEFRGTDETVSSLDLKDDRPTPEQVRAHRELRNAIMDGISSLRHNLRTVVLLREVHGLTSAETARKLGLTVTAVKARTFHARRKLRRHFEKKLDTTGVAAWQIP